MHTALDALKQYLRPGHPALYLALLWCLALTVMVNWAEGYRVFAYLNLLAVLGYAASRLVRRTRIRPGAIGGILAFPLGFTLLHVATVGGFDLAKDLRHLWLAAFVAFGVWIAAGRARPLLARALWPMLGLLLIAYAAIQFAGIAMGFDTFGSGEASSPYRAISYGVTSNPHYLALYSALGLPLALYCMASSGGWRRWAMAGTAAALAYLVLLASSRPAWLALIAGALVAALFLRGRHGWKIAAAGLLIPLLLYLGNVAHFGDRMAELGRNVAKEERVTIWQDAWRMQQASSVAEWVYGHGIGSFKEDFKRYSRFHAERDFHHPHNTVLEVLYVSGVLGVMLGVALYWALYRGLVRLSRTGAEFAGGAALLATLLAVHFVMVMLTLPFYSRYNFYPLAFIGGALIALRTQAHPREP